MKTVEQLAVDEQIIRDYGAILSYAAKNDAPIEDFNLSTRSYNCLKCNEIDTFYKMVSIYPDGYTRIRNMGVKSFEEINNTILRYFTDGSIKSQAEGEEYQNTQKENFNVELLSVLQLLKHSNTKDRAWDYIYKNDIEVALMNLSNRSTHALLNAGLVKFSSILKVYPVQTAFLKGLGAKSVNEINSSILSNLERIESCVRAYCLGDVQALYSDEYIKKTILDQFEDKDFAGLSFLDIRGEFPENIDENRIKRIIGTLIRDNVLEYVDFRCYRVYPSFSDILKEDYELSNDRNKDYLLRKYNGETLESIAKSEGLTRERVRQICDRQYKKIKNKNAAENGLEFFDEDYYAYFYSTYETSKEFFSSFLKLPDSIFSYLRNTYTKGKQSYIDALNDPKLDLGLKIRIRDYLNKDKIEVDGELIDQNRQSAEDFILEHYCQEELTYTEFISLYNEVLKRNNVNSDEMLLSDDVSRARSNRLSESRRCLWKQGERLRYYDIDAGDYSDLLETINLKEYVDIDISTLKFMEDYPEVMEQYDIHDEYELHNLLKKLIGNDVPNNMRFSRQPVISFGQPNRMELYQKILNAVSPVTAEEFAEYIHMETGFSKPTILGSVEIQQLSKYYHNGIYSIDFKRLPDEHAYKLSTLLKDDFYYIDEILNIYKNNFSEADLEYINPRSLKSIGFNIFSGYAIKNYPTAESYFRHLLTKDDVFDITQYRLRYGTIMMFTQLVMDLRKEKEIFLFEKNQYINFRRLEKVGVTKQMIEDFCNEVNDVVCPNTFFTIQSLRSNGFSHDLENLGFDDIFYAGILAVSPFFCYQRVYGNIVLYSGKSSKTFSIKDFIQNLLKEYDDIDIDDFIDDVYEKYGIRIPDKYDITGAVAGTDMYYDNIMNKVYSNKALYYSDLDD